MDVNDFDICVNPDGTLRQEDGASCGFFSLKWAEMHASGMKDVHTKLNQKEVTKYRAVLVERLKELWTETMVDSNDVIWCPDGGMEDFDEDSHSDGGWGCAEVDDDHDMWNDSEDLEEDIDWDVWSKEDSFDGDDGDIDDELVSDSDEDEG